MKSHRFLICAISSCLLGVMLTGCQNRCNQPYGFPYQQQPFTNQFGYVPPINPNLRSPLIPPPATNAINIPSRTGNNPFNRGLLSTNERAPTPRTDRAARFNQQNGWRPSEGSSSRGNFNSNSNSNQNNSGTTLGFNRPQGASNSYDRFAQAPGNATSRTNPSTANDGFGQSFINSRDYATTSVNETNDRTRLPATDASAVRAPSQYEASVQGARVAQFNPQFVGNQQPYYVPGQGQLSPSQLAFNSNSTVRVQDQRTATYDPYSNNTRSADWRNQDNNGNDPF